MPSTRLSRCAFWPVWPPIPEPDGGSWSDSSSAIWTGGCSPSNVASRANKVGPTKTKRVRRLTLGRTTVELWRTSETACRQRVSADTEFGEWLFSRDLDHRRRLTASGLGHWFADLRDDAGLDGASLHRLRHTVATYLVGRGDLLQAQHRLGHRDASTTLRNYAHAMPLEDESIADDIDEMLSGQTYPNP
jgi:integrase